MSLVPAAERAGAMEAVEAIIAHEPEADQILREAVVALYERIPDVHSVAVAFVENGELAPGPTAGEPISGTLPLAGQSLYEGVRSQSSGSRAAARPTRRPGTARARVRLLSPYCLVGWDTGGEAWEP